MEHSHQSSRNAIVGEIIVLSRELYDQISAIHIKKIFEEVNSLDFNFTFKLSDKFDHFYLKRITISSTFIGKIQLFISFHFQVDIKNWNCSWSVNKHINDFTELINKHQLIFNNEEQFRTHEKSFFNPENSDAFRDFLLVDVTVNSDNYLTLGNIIDTYIEVFIDVHRQILEKYGSLQNPSSLSEYFNFPLEVKTACEQYLLYFAEFLSDVGIEVTTSLAEKDENVIFTVEPKNKQEALENISQLLKLYLQLPTSPVVNSYQSSSELSFPAQRLQAQVLQLQSQLTLANAERQYLNVTIQQKDTLITQQAQTIQSQQFTAQILVDSLHKKETDEEELVGQIIRVKDYEAGPLAIGLPKLLRRLKALFGSK